MQNDSTAAIKVISHFHPVLFHQIKSKLKMLEMMVFKINIQPCSDHVAMIHVYVRFAR